ncbi:MAG: hypothetical protein GX242_00155 [Clostridiales bacterium]|nr:hypothetical protein [Clostridiales bacterium]
MKDLDFLDWEKLGGVDLNKDGEVDYLEYDLLYEDDVDSESDDDYDDLDDYNSFDDYSGDLDF